MMSAVPWLFLIPPAVVTALAIGTLLYARSPAGRARAHLRAGGTAVYSQDLEKAEKEFRAGLALRPNHAGLLGALGSLLTTLDRFDEALPMLEKARAADPNDQRLAVLVGRCHEGTGDAEAARTIWDSIPAQTDAFVDAQVLLAERHEAAGDLDEAQERLTRAVETASAVRARALKREIRRLKKEIEGRQA